MSTELSPNADKNVKYPYPDPVEKMMRKVYIRLSEKDRRIYSAVESSKLGYGGKEYICNVLGCTPKTIDKGVRILKGEDTTLS